VNETKPNATHRWETARDLVVFQLKLVADGARDMVLIPTSLVAGLFGLLFSRDNPSGPFYQVLALGKRSEHWINLFGSLPESRHAEASDSIERIGNLDNVVNRMERLLVEQYERGGITATAKHSIDKYLDALNKGLSKTSRGKGDEADQ
jgi:hypothetical protein